MALRQLSNADPDGTQLGQSASDKVAFYGATPVVQASKITSNAGTASTVANQVNALQAAFEALGLSASE